MSEHQITAELFQCAHCREAVVMLNGVSTQELTFWTREGRPKVTAHKANCPYRGKAAPSAWDLIVGEETKWME